MVGWETPAMVSQGSGFITIIVIFEGDSLALLYYWATKHVEGLLSPSVLMLIGREFRIPP